MHLQDAENYLPTPLRGSKLPWEPVWDDQAAAPRDGDGWRARVGLARFELDANDYSEFGSGPGLTFELRLFHDLTNREQSSWTLDRLQDASIVADSAHQMLLDALIRQLEPAQEALHDAA